MVSYQTMKQKGYPGRSRRPVISVIIPTFNNIARLRTALERWSRIRYDHATVIVVNDGSTDGTREMLDQTFPQVVQLAGDGNLWFAGSCNMGLRYAIEHAFDYVTVFNDDNYVEPDLIEQQVACAREHPDCVIGIKTYKLGTDKVIWAIGARLTKRFMGVGFTWLGKDLPELGAGGGPEQDTRWLAAALGERRAEGVTCPGCGAEIEGDLAGGVGSEALPVGLDGV